VTKRRTPCTLLYMTKTSKLEPRTPPLLVIVGETASGKTSLAIAMAKQLNGEIICADSSTVRREANIGTAKPTTEEQVAVPHHLLDIVGPDEVFTAALFKEKANAAIIDITGRGKLPILVGGTGLYIDGVIYDYDFLPQGDPDLRKELSELSIDELQKRAKGLGINLDEVDIQNPRRLIRLIETNGSKPTRKELRGNTAIIGIEIDRQILKQRVNRRVHDMLEAGLQQEVWDLSDKYSWECEALKGVGYSQWQDHFLHDQTIPETRQKIIKATMDLAKRQRTWFKRNKSIHWLQSPVNRGTAVAFATTTLDT